MLRRLTEKQYRRVALLYGFDGPAMTEREAAEAEGVDRRAVHDSKNQALGRRREVECEDTLIDAVTKALWRRIPSMDREAARGHALMLRHRMGERWLSGVREVREPGKLSSDGYLWFLWLVGKNFTLRDMDLREERGISPAAPEALDSHRTRFKTNKNTQKKDPIIYPDERGVVCADDKWGDRSSVETRPSGLRWESDRYTPMSRYDRRVNELTEQYELGAITRVEYETDLVMALADDQQNDGTEEGRARLRQQVEWAAGAFLLGAIGKREYDRRVSLALRSYVRQG